MAKLIILQREKFIKDMSQIINKMSGNLIVVCTYKQQYDFIKKNCGEVNVIFFKLNFLINYLNLFNNKFLKKSFLYFIILKIISNFLYPSFIKIIKDYKINQICSDSIYFNIFGLILKKIKKKKNINSTLFYFFEHDYENETLKRICTHYDKNFLNNVFFKFIYFFSKNNKNVFLDFKNFIISKYSRSQIFFIMIFKINVGNSFNRITFDIFENIYCVDYEIMKKLKINFPHKKIKMMKNKSIDKKKRKYKFLITTHPFYSHKFIKNKFDDVKIYEEIIKGFLKIDNRIILYAHPNNDDEEKKSLKSLADKFKIDFLVGGNFHNDICEAEICISHYQSTVVTICNKLNVENITYTLDFENIISVDKRYLNEIKNYNEGITKINKIDINYNQDIKNLKINGKENLRKKFIFNDEVLKAI